MTGAPVLSIEEAIAQVRIGHAARYARPITGELIRLYAEVSGDFHDLHLDADYARAAGFASRIAHGAMMVGFMSTASTLLSEEIEAETGRTNVSLGYDRLRFVKPVLEGDTVTTTATVTARVPEKSRVLCAVSCLNQRGDTVAAAEHIMRFV